MSFFGPFQTVIPPAMLASALVWGGANYFLIGPKIGERVVRADYLASCSADVKALAGAARDKKMAAIPLPSIDPMQEFARRQTEGILNSPFMKWAEGASRSSGRSLGDIFGLDLGGAAAAAREQFEANQRAAGKAFRDAQAAVRKQTEARIASADDLCACIGQTAIEETRTEWAIFTGTLTLYTPAPIESFKGAMAAVAKSGVCEGRDGARS